MEVKLEGKKSKVECIYGRDQNERSEFLIELTDVSFIQSERAASASPLTEKKLLMD